MPLMRFLITAGPTREAIDPVRYLTNHSSGKMGYCLAEAAVHEGHSVLLISGPTSWTFRTAWTSCRLNVHRKCMMLSKTRLPTPTPPSSAPP